MMLGSGCKDNNANKGLDNLIVKLAEKDQTIDADDWQQIIEYLDANKARLSDFYDDGTIDTEDVMEYITDFFANRRKPMEIQFVGVGNGKSFLTVKFYLERSGSMTPYDAPDCNGEFKAAIVKMLNAAPGNEEDNVLFVVNSEVNKYPAGIQQFIRDDNIFTSTKDMGDPSFTDFGLILDEVLNKNKSGELSILVSDMIYSPKNTAGINPQKVFSSAEGMVNSVFKNQVKSKSMLVLKMNSSYSGPYYPYNYQSKGLPYRGYRPYYFLIVGDNADIARLSTDEKYADFTDFKSLSGYENMYLFDASGVYSPFYSLLTKSSDSRGRFRSGRGQGGQIVSLDDVETDKNSGDLQLVLGVNLDKMFIDPNYLVDASNYVIESPHPIKIKEIRPIDEESDLDVNQHDLKGKMTHVFVLSTDKVINNEEVKIKLLNVLPSWVSLSSTDDDTNLSSPGFSTTTFGLEYIMKGIYDSYKKMANGSQPVYFTLTLSINK